MDLLPRLSGRSLKDVFVQDHTGSYQRARPYHAGGHGV
jgi:hypothetical protein